MLLRLGYRLLMIVLEVIECAETLRKETGGGVGYVIFINEIFL